MVECEIRSFVSDDQYARLLAFFAVSAESLGEDCQVTYYYDCPQDLRIQKNSRYAKVWLKKGELHDESREEIEVRVGQDDFERLERLFEALGYKVEIKWFRHRRSYRWQGLDVSIDDTRGFGRILELEKRTDEAGQEPAISELKTRLAELGIEQTPKQEFQSRFEHYRRNWRQLTAESVAA
jgi:predicted adenylyl cyclase CyaB